MLLLLRQWRVGQQIAQKKTVNIPTFGATEELLSLSLLRRSFRLLPRVYIPDGNSRELNAIVLLTAHTPRITQRCEVSKRRMVGLEATNATVDCCSAAIRRNIVVCR